MYMSGDIPEANEVWVPFTWVSAISQTKTTLPTANAYHATTQAISPSITHYLMCDSRGRSLKLSTNGTCTTRSCRLLSSVHKESGHHVCNLGVGICNYHTTKDHGHWPYGSVADLCLGMTRSCQEQSTWASDSLCIGMPGGAFYSTAMRASSTAKHPGGKPQLAQCQKMTMFVGNK
jgi:hypothetical protein